MDVLYWVAPLLVGLVAFVSIGAVRPGGLRRGMRLARRTGDITAVVAAIEKMSPETRETHWDHAINALWQVYDREAAAALVVEAAKRCDAGIIHYWVQQVLQVEPEIAQETFTLEFLEAHFDPAAAASCGRCGSCG